MKLVNRLIFMFFTALMLGFCANAAYITDLQTDRRVTPMGIGNTAPEFSWKMVSEERGAAQTSYRIVVTNDKTDQTVWDSGEVQSDISNAVKYGGSALESATRYNFAVTVRDEDGVQLETVSSWFETGFYNKEDWSGAGFIAPYIGENPENYSVEFDFRIESVTAGFVFGAVDTSHFLMWQVSSYNYSTSTPDWKVTVRPHEWNGSAKCITEIDISHIIPISDAYKTHRLKLEIKGDTVYTYVDGVKLDWTYTSDYAAFGKFGFREVSNGNVYSEAAYFDNLTIKDDDTGRIIYSNDFSETAEPFTVGKLTGGELRQQDNYVSTVFDVVPEVGTSAPMFRKEFTAKKTVRSARLYSTSLGIYEAFINGSKVGSDKMAPGWTDYNVELQYQVYDVTDMIKVGENAIGATVGNGWYSGRVSTGGRINRYGVDEAFLGKLVINYTDGTSDVIGTDTTWRSSLDGPYLDTCNQNGETYDATKEMPGWNTADFDDSAWLGTQIAAKTSINTLVDPQNINLIAEIQNPIKVTEERPVKFLAETSDGVYVYDVGQNISGVIRIKLKGEAGQTVRIRHGEMVRKGTNKLYTENLREAKATDLYTLKGDPDGEIYEPAFTFHGFRYIEISGLDYRPDENDITALVIHTEMTRTGCIETDNAKVNQLFSNIIWSQRDNYLSVATDCPQRDERLGWTGDAQVFSRTGMLNFDTNAFMTKFINDVDTARNTETGAIYDIAPKQGHDVTEGNSGWADFAVIVPWNMYLAYGDVTVLSDNWDMMTGYLAYCESKAGDDLLMPADAYGDWLSIGETTPINVSATAFYGNAANLMSKAAAVLGKTEEAAYYNDLFLRIREAYAGAYVNAETGVITGDTQAIYALSLRFDMLPTAELRDKAASNLVRRIEERGIHLTTGVMGCGHLLPALTDAGYGDVAYQLLLTESYPSWLYSVNNGATTIWERWNSYIAETDTFGNINMNSFNHYAYGAVGEWMYMYAAGIRYDENAPGYKHIIIKPVPGDRFGSFGAEYDSVYGKIASAWTLEDESFTLSVTIPANTTATIYVPCTDEASLTADGYSDVSAVDGLAYKGVSDGSAVFEAVSGSYVFTSELEEKVSLFVNMDDSADGHTFADVYINGEKASYGRFNKGEEVILELRTLNEDYILGSWDGIGSTDNPLKIVVDSDLSLTASVKYSGRNNMALGKTVSAKTNDGAKPAWQLSNLTDGLYIATDSFYGYASSGSSGADTNQWIVIDLGCDMTFDRVNLYPRTEAYAEGGLTPAFPVDFTIQVSSDGVNYKTVVTETGYEAPYRVPARFIFEKQTARYIKVDASKLGLISTNDLYHRLQFAEIGVYSEENTLWVSYAGQHESVSLGDGTYTFPENCMGDTVDEWRLSDGSVYYPGDTAQVKAIEGLTAVPLADKLYAAKPAEYDSSLGELVYFDNFRADGEGIAALDVLDGTGSYIIDGKYAVKASNENSAIMYYAGNMIHGIEIISADGLGNRFTYKDGTPITGKITISVEGYNPDTAFTMRNVAGNKGAIGSDEWCGYYVDWSGKTVPTAAWTQWNVKTAQVTDEMLRIGTRADALNKNIYFHSVAVYINEPENALWLADERSENRVFEIVPGSTYTFPDSLNGKAVSVWTDGTDKYTAGQTADISAVAGKTFTPEVPPKYASVPESCSESLGQLVYFNNFSTEDFGNIAHLDVLDATTLSVIDGKYVTKASNANSVNTHDTGSMVHGIEIISADGLGNRFTYKDGTPITGKITVCFEAYNADSVSNMMYSVAGNKDAVGPNEWCGFYVDWSGKSIPAASWAAWNVKTVAVNDDLTRLGARVGALNRNIYFHSVAVYIKEPDNALWLADEKGENRIFTVVSGSTFDFPDTHADKIVLSWTDGESTYASGDSVPLASIAGKTFYPSLSADYPTTLDAASIKVSLPQALRYACFVPQELREAADEYGFIVAAESALENANPEDTAFELLIFGNADITCSSVKAYTKGGDDYSEFLTENEAKDIFPEKAMNGISSDGYYFTVMLTDIPEEHYTDVLVGKPYIKIGDKHYYGSAVRGSVYGVAQALKEKYGDNVPGYVTDIIDSVTE